MKRKRIMYIVIAVVVVLFILKSFHIKERAVTLLGRTREVPHSVKEFPLIPESKDSSFVITALNRNPDVHTTEYHLYKKENGDYIIELREHGLTDENRFQIHYYCVAPDGTILDVLKLPDNLYFKRGYIVGQGIYCNWTTTGDTTIYNATTIDGELSKDEFRSYYDRATAVCLFSTDAMLLIEGKWHFARLDFHITSGFDPKGKILYGNIPGYPDHPAHFDPTYKDKPYHPLFTDMPQTTGELEFCFFEKLRYHKARTSGASFNPAGGQSWPEQWSGTGYFRLKFPQSEFCFKHWANYRELHDKWYYELPFEIYKNNEFAIIKVRSRVYLVQSK